MGNGSRHNQLPSHVKTRSNDENVTNRVTLKSKASGARSTLSGGRSRVMCMACWLLVDAGLPMQRNPGTQ